MKKSQKVEETERKYATQPFQTEIELQFTPNNEFPQHQEDEYIDCQYANHHIKNCNVMKRIMFLLAHYQMHHHTEIYEHLLSLKDYNVSTFLEDWYQIKTYHLHENDNIEWIRNNIETNCDNKKQCLYLSRYQRERGSETHDSLLNQIDNRNIILIDQLDSIHAFLFHSMQQRTAWKTHRNIKCTFDNESKEKNMNGEDAEFIWENKPKHVQQCNVEQILWIVNELFDKSTQRIADKLIHHKSDIMKYIKEQGYDGSKLQATKRKGFISNMA
eukprot:172506_1